MSAASDRGRHAADMELRHVKNLFKNHFIALYQLISLFSKKSTGQML